MKPVFGIGGAEWLILMVAGLFILGPERLPSAATWLARTVKQVREYATGAREQLKNELGPEFDELRKPLAELQALRGFNPRTAITKHLLDGDDSFLFGPSSVAEQANTTVGEIGSDLTGAGGSSAMPIKATVNPSPAPPALAPGEHPPFDADAT